MINLTKKEIETLINSNLGICISFYLPINKTQNALQQNKIVFKNLIKEATLQLSEYGIKQQEIDSLLKPAYIIENDRLFWFNQKIGLSIFISKEQVFSYKLPYLVPTIAVVNKRFYIKPLLPLLQTNDTFYLLCLSHKNIRVFQGNRFELKEIEDETIPRNIQDVLKYEVYEPQVQVHTAFRSNMNKSGAVVYHGQGVGTDDYKDEIFRFFKKIDNALVNIIKGSDAPLVLAGINYLIPIYRLANTYRNLISESLIENVEYLKKDILHTKIWKIVQPYIESLKKRSLERYELLSIKYPEIVTNDIDRILKSAYEGKIDSLFISLDNNIWGQYDKNKDCVIIHNSKEPGDYDLIDESALFTLRHNGKIFVITPDQISSNKPIAAILRY